MKLLISKNILYSLFLFFGVGLGVFVYFMVNNFDSVLSWLKVSEKPIVTNTDESKAPYFTSGVRDYAIGETDQILFKVFQPEVLEYYSEDGVWYMKTRYVPAKGGEATEINVLLVLDLYWGMTQEVFDNIKEDDPHQLAKASIIYSKFYDPENVSYDSNDEGIRIDAIKEKFPVGKRIAMRIPVDYKSGLERTEEYCSSFAADVCDYLRLVDRMGVKNWDLFVGEGLSESSVVVPYSISNDIQLDLSE